MLNSSDRARLDILVEDATYRLFEEVFSVFANDDPEEVDSHLDRVCGIPGYYDWWKEGEE